MNIRVDFLAPTAEAFNTPNSCMEVLDG
jgi:hypothetical protein